HVLLLLDAQPLDHVPHAFVQEARGLPEDEARGVEAREVRARRDPAAQAVAHQGEVVPGARLLDDVAHEVRVLADGEVAALVGGGRVAVPCEVDGHDAVAAPGEKGEGAEPGVGGVPQAVEEDDGAGSLPGTGGVVVDGGAAMLHVAVLDPLPGQQVAHAGVQEGQRLGVLPGGPFRHGSITMDRHGTKASPFQPAKVNGPFGPVGAYPMTARVSTTARTTRRAALTRAGRARVRKGLTRLQPSLRVGTKPRSSSAAVTPRAKTLTDSPRKRGMETASLKRSGVRAM